MFTRLGHLTVRRRRIVLAASVLFLVVAGALGSGVFGVLQGGGFNDPNSESTRASEILATEFEQVSADVVAVVTPEAGLEDPAVPVAMAALTDEIRSIEGIASAVSYWELGHPESLRSIDGEHALVVLTVDPTLGEDDADAVVAALLERFDGDQVDGITIDWAGIGPVFSAIGTQVEADLALAQTIAIPITLVLLIFVFRSVIAASLPLLIGILSIMGTFLALFVLGSITDVSIYAINLTTALGLGLGIDFSLFMVSRFREELQSGSGVEEAVVRTVETAGRTIFFSGATTMLSLSALVVFPLYFLRSFAYAGVATIALATAAAIVTLPALLAVVGARVNRFTVGRPVRAIDPDNGPLARMARWVMARPVGVATAVIVVLLAAGVPFLRAEFATPDHRVLPQGNEARVANEILRDEFASTESNAFGVVGLDVEARSSQADRIAATLSSFDMVGRVDAASGTWVGGQLVGGPIGDPNAFVGTGDTWWNVVPTVEPTSTAGQELVTEIRALDAGADLLVGGGAAELVDTKSAIADRLPIVGGIIVVATLGLMFLLLGSVLLPIKAVLLNLISLTATYGAMVLVFQDGWFAGVLGFTPTGAIDTTMPILMFCVAFGLSIDYEVFLLSRIREEHDLGADTETATARGIQRTGGLVTASAMLLAVTFGAFAAGGTTFIKLFGLGLTVAVLTDAFFVRITLVPAVMKLAGERTWWAPSWLTRIHHAVEGAPARPAAIDLVETELHVEPRPAGVG